MNKFAEKHWIIIGFIGAVILDGIIVFLFFCSNDSKLQEQLDLGQKYMEDCDYEQAIVAFNEAIVIDDRCPQAYIGLVETYIRMNDFEHALEVAQKGHELTNNEQLAFYIRMLESGNISRSDGKTVMLTEYDSNGLVIFSHEYTYDNKGRQNSVTHYDGNHTLVSSVELVYDEEGNELVGYAWGEKGRLIKYEYSYEQGLMTSKISFDEQNPEWFMYEYNEDGLMIREVVGLGSSIGLKDEVFETREYTYDNQGRNIRIDCTQLDGFKYSHEWEYDGDKVVKYSMYNGDGSLQSYETWEYEEDMTIYSIYTGDGTLRWYSITKDGVTNKYDGEGNLIGYEEYN